MNPHTNLYTKVLEIRDSMTFIPVIAIKMLSRTEVQEWYIHYRGGYSQDGSSIILINLDTGISRPLKNSMSSNDAFYWNDRTMTIAHQYIEENFDSLCDGDVIDVEFILGETDKKKISERFN